MYILLVTSWVLDEAVEKKHPLHMTISSSDLVHMKQIFIVENYFDILVLTADLEILFS